MDRPRVNSFTFRGLSIESSATSPLSQEGESRFDLLKESKHYVRKLSMSSATPGVGECNICFEIVPCVKVLECTHTVCVSCANRMVHAQSSEKPSLICPECRQPTDVTRGVQYLPTKYFGKIKCDLCLQQKETEDVWWCSDCVQAICSKCSIKEHSRKNHSISEWNKMGPVKYSVRFIENIRAQRQQSTGLERNRRIVKEYLSAVEDCLQKRLSLQPELEALKSSLLTHYGNKFSPSSSPFRSRSNSCTELSAPLKMCGDGAPKVVAKVLQLAGANVVEKLIPNVDDHTYQVQFTMTPEDLSGYLMARLELVPMEFSEKEAIECAVIPSSPSPSTVVTRKHSPGKSVSQTSPVTTPNNLNYDTILEEEISFQKPKSDHPFVQADITNNGVISLRTEHEIFLCNMLSGKTHTTRVQANKLFRSFCFNQFTNELYVATQGTHKRHDWQIELWNITTLPYTTLFTGELDIDPDDKVLELFLHIDQKQDVIYELRFCEGQVSEIWRAINIKEGKGKRTKTKIKETSLFQRVGARYISMKVVDSVGDKNKDKFIIAYDAISKSIQRLLLKNNKCEFLNKVLNTNELIPFTVDHHGLLWVFDYSLMELCVSTSTVGTKAPVTFRSACPYAKLRVAGMRHSFNDENKLYGVAVGPQNIIVVVFKTV